MTDHIVLGSIGELFPGSIQEARAIMLLNLASAYAIRGENEKSKRVLQQVGIFNLFLFSIMSIP